METEMYNKDIAILEKVSRFLGVQWQRNTDSDALSFTFGSPIKKSGLFTTPTPNTMRTCENILIGVRSLIGLNKSMDQVADSLLKNNRILMVYKSTHFDGDKCLAILIDDDNAKSVVLTWLDGTSTEVNIERIKHALPAQ